MDKFHIGIEDMCLDVNLTRSDIDKLTLLYYANSQKLSLIKREIT